jgi:hypothetical protein
MNGKLTRWLVCGAMAFGSEAIGFAADSVVQDFDGWKITIQPGDFPVAAGTRDHVPPSPTVFSTQAGSAAKSIVQLVSLRQNEAIELPAPPAPTPEPHVDGLPLIVPGECFDKEGVVSVEPPAGRVDPRYMSQMYYEIYKSIPFIRAEYDANPSYIHDATMEFLFGQMRPTVIHRGTTNVNHNFPDYGYGYGYGFNGYAYPPLQLVVPGVGLRIHRN